jgi:hypothetical protein
MLIATHAAYGSPPYAPAKSPRFACPADRVKLTSALARADSLGDEAGFLAKRKFGGTSTGADIELSVNLFRAMFLQQACKPARGRCRIGYGTDGGNYGYILESGCR